MSKPVVYILFAIAVIIACFLAYMQTSLLL